VTLYGLCLIERREFVPTTRIPPFYLHHPLSVHTGGHSYHDTVAPPATSTHRWALLSWYRCTTRYQYTQVGTLIMIPLHHPLPVHTGGHCLHYIRLCIKYTYTQVGTLYIIALPYLYQIHVHTGGHSLHYSIAIYIPDTRTHRWALFTLYHCYIYTRYTDTQVGTLYIIALLYTRFTWVLFTWYRCAVENY
jgi:hypothetical protein